MQVKARALKTYAEILYWRAREKQEEGEAALRRVNEVLSEIVEKNGNMDKEELQKEAERDGWGDKEKGGLPIREKPKSGDDSCN